MSSTATPWQRQQIVVVVLNKAHAFKLACKLPSCMVHRCAKRQWWMWWWHFYFSSIKQLKNVMQICAVCALFRLCMPTWHIMRLSSWSHLCTSGIISGSKKRKSFAHAERNSRNAGPNAPLYIVFITCYAVATDSSRKNSLFLTRSAMSAKMGEIVSQINRSTQKREESNSQLVWMHKQIFLLRSIVNNVNK